MDEDNDLMDELDEALDSSNEDEPEDDDPHTLPNPHESYQLPAVNDEADDLIDEDNVDFRSQRITEDEELEEGIPVEMGRSYDAEEQYQSVYERYADVPDESDRYSERRPSDGVEGGDKTSELQQEKARTQERNMHLLNAMTLAQNNRYEAYKRSTLPAPKIKKIMQHVMGDSAPQRDLVLAMRGVAKMFVGDIVETARQVASDMDHTGPLLPVHVHRAYGILAASGRVPTRERATKKLRI